MTFLNNPDNRIEILCYTEFRFLSNDEYPDDVNIEFTDPEDPELSYCVGFTYVGPEIRLESSYMFDHVNRCDDWNGEKVSREVVEEICRRYDTNIDEIFSECLRRFQSDFC